MEDRQIESVPALHTSNGPKEVPAISNKLFSSALHAGPVRTNIDLEGQSFEMAKWEEPSTSYADNTKVVSGEIASVLEPVMKEFERRVVRAARSQSTLNSSIDRLTRDLDKLLDDTPLTLGTHQAAMLSVIRKRVLSLAETLLLIQRRINHMELLLSDQLAS